MADDQTSQSYYDMFDDDNEMAFTPLSPQFGFDVLEHGSSEPGHATTLSNHTTRNLPTRSAPPYSYPNAVTSARAGSRSLPTSTLTNSTSISSGASTIATTTNSPSPGPVATVALNLPHAASPTTASYACRPLPPYGYQPSLGWTSSSSSNSLYNSGSDTSAPGGQLFDFGAFGGQDGQPAGPASFGSDFIAPSSLQHSNFNFGGFAPNPWHETGDAPAATVPGASAHLNFPNNVSPTAHGEDVVASEPPPPASLSRHHKRAKKSTSSKGAEEPPSPGAATIASHVSRGSLASSKSAASSTSATTGSGVNKSKLRSASRTSKNTHHKPAETLEERKTRASHNLVEKQYRNRLNAQFESLLNALPDFAHEGGEDGEDGEGDGDRRVSKAEVLDMARRHIKQLEKERLDLERERNELVENMEKLQETYASGVPPSGATGLVPMAPPTGPAYQNINSSSSYARLDEDSEMSNRSLPN